MTMLDDLVLYELTGCPYCAKVNRFLADNDLDLPRRDIDEGNNNAELVALGGRSQCPCLIVGGKALYESDAIIDYLRTRVDGSAKRQGSPRGMGARLAQWLHGGRG